MRTLLAIAIVMGGVLALGAPADAADPAPKTKRAETKRAPKTVPSRPSRHGAACERAEHADRTGVYAGYPCWGQEALSQGGWSVR